MHGRRASYFFGLKLVTNSYFCRHLHRKIATFRFTGYFAFVAAPFGHGRQLRNRRLEQDKVSARLARVEPDDGTTLCGECETFRRFTP
jgi:hypothetical protein